MKTAIQLCICFLLAGLSIQVVAQEEQAQDSLKRGSIHPGFIITLKGDTVRGYLLNINLLANQKMTFYYKDSSDFKGRIKYKAKEIKAYQVGNRYYESMKYSFTNSTLTHNFILKKLDGPTELYMWYYNPDQPDYFAKDLTLEDISKAVLFNETELWINVFGMKPDGEFTELTGLRFLMKFAKNMSAYVADNAELAQKIHSKTKGYQGIPRDLENIIREYNKWKTEQDQKIGMMSN
jgi:hypothetical protein